MQCQRQARLIMAGLAAAMWLLMSAAAPAGPTPSVTFWPKAAGVGSRLTVTVDQMPIQDVTKASDKSKVVLFLGGLPFKGLCTEGCCSTNKGGQFSFILQRTDSTRTNWVVLLGSPKHWTKPVELGIGWDGDCVAQTAGTDTMELTVIREHSLWAFGGVLVLFIYGFLVLALRTEMLRDSGPSQLKTRPPHRLGVWHYVGWGAIMLGGALTWLRPQGNWFFWATLIVVAVWWLSDSGLQRPPPNSLKPFSLARSQMALWFFLVVIAFVFLWLVTRSLDTLNSTVLALIGVAAGTALGAEAQNAGKPTTLDKLKVESQTLAAKPVAERTPEVTRRLTELERQMATETVKGAPVSNGFFDDILTDASGISFHRFQMAIWTLVLCFIFIVEVYRNLGMPEFGGNLLALMGISNGTYLGFMIPEPHASDTSKQ